MAPTASTETRTAAAHQILFDYRGSGRSCLASASRQPLQTFPGTALEITLQQIEQLGMRPFRLLLVVDIAAGHRPAMQRALINFAVIAAAPGLERIVQFLDRIWRHALVFHRMPEIELAF